MSAGSQDNALLSNQAPRGGPTGLTTTHHSAQPWGDSVPWLRRRGKALGQHRERKGDTSQVHTERQSLV